MAKTTESKILKDLVSEIERNTEALKQYPEPSINLAATEIQIAAHKIEASFIGLRTLLWMSLAFLILAITIALTFYSSNNRIKILNEKLVAQSAPSNIDSLTNTILLDSVGHIKYSVDEKGRPITYMDLLRENTRLKDSLQSSKTLLDMARDSFGISYTITKKGENSYYTMKSSVLDKINKNVEEANTILKKKLSRYEESADSIK